MGLSAMECLATLESAITAVEVVTSTKFGAAMEVVSIAKLSASEISPAVKVAPTIIFAAIESAIVAIISPRMSPIRAIPGPRSDKYAIHEPIRAVVAVRRASVRIVAVVSVCAGRRRSVIAIDANGRCGNSNPNPYRHMLRLRVRRRNQQQSTQSAQHRKHFQRSHCPVLLRAVPRAFAANPSALLSPERNAWDLPNCVSTDIKGTSDVFSNAWGCHLEHPSAPGTRG